LLDKAVFIGFYLKYLYVVALRKSVPCYSRSYHMVTVEKMVLSIILTRTMKVFFIYVIYLCSYLFVYSLYALHCGFTMFLNT